MSNELPSHGATDVVHWHSWLGDVELPDGESGELGCHFGPVAYVEFADGIGHRYQALTVGNLNALLAHLGVEVACAPDRLNQVECICDLCKIARVEQRPSVAEAAQPGQNHPLAAARSGSRRNDRQL